MRSVLFEIPTPWGGIPLHSYGLMILVGFFLATWVAAREARRRHLPEFVYDLGVVMLLCGLLGGRLNHYIQYHDAYEGKSFLEFFKLWNGGLVFYGGAISGFAGGLVYLFWKRLPILDALDAMSLGAPIAMAFGRIGCFLHGCCFGRLCSPTYALAVQYPTGAPVHERHLARGLIEMQSDLPLLVHPAQLYQSAHDFLMFALMFLYLRSPRQPPGTGMSLIFVLYGIGRFAIEGLRGDHSEEQFAGWTYSQTLSLVLILVFGVLFVVFWIRGARRVPAPAAS